MLIIRFSRVGKRNHAQYKVVLAEKTYPVQGKFNEILGSYDPHLKVALLKEDRIKYWLSQGVTCSDTAYNLLVKQGLVEGKKRPVKLPKKKVDAAEAQAGDSKPSEAEAKPAEDASKPAEEETKTAETAAPAEEKKEA